MSGGRYKFLIEDSTFPRLPCPHRGELTENERSERKKERWEREREIDRERVRERGGRRRRGNEEREREIRQGNQRKAFTLIPKKKERTKKTNLSDFSVKTPQSTKKHKHIPAQWGVGNPSLLQLASRAKNMQAPAHTPFETLN